MRTSVVDPATSRVREFYAKQQARQGELNQKLFDVVTVPHMLADGDC